MAPKSKSTPSLQSIVDTYHYLIGGWRQKPTTVPPRHAHATARQIAVPTTLRREMVATLRTMPQGLGVAGLSTASVKGNGNLFLLSDSLRPFAHSDETSLIPLALQAEADASSAATVAWHRYLYAHSNAQAIVMSHAAGAIVCATAGIAPDPAHFPAAAATIGAVRCVAADPATWRDALMEGAPLLVADGTLITYDLTLIGAIAKADMGARWCEVATGSPK